MSETTNAVLRLRRHTPLEYEFLVDAPEVPAPRSLSASPPHAIAGDVLRLEDDDLTPVQLRRGRRRIGDPEWWQVSHLFDGLSDPWAAAEDKPAHPSLSTPRLGDGNELTGLRLDGLHRAADPLAQQLARYEGPDLEAAHLMLELMWLTGAAGVAIGWRYRRRRHEPIAVSVELRADPSVRWIPEDPGNVVEVIEANAFGAVAADASHPDLFVVLVRPREAPRPEHRSRAIWMQLLGRAAPFTESAVALGHMLAATTGT